MFSKEKIYNNIFNILFVILMFAYFLFNYVNIDLNTVTRMKVNMLILLGFLSIFIFRLSIFKRISKINLLSISILSLFIIFKAIFKDNLPVEYSVLIFILSIGLLNENNIHFIRYLIISKVIFLFFIMLLSQLGYINQSEFIKQDYSIALSYGFIHSNTLGIIGLSIILDLSLLYRYNRAPKHIILLSIIFICYMYFISKARTSLLLEIGLIIAMILNMRLIKIRCSGVLLVTISLLIILMGIILPYYFDSNSELWNKLNILFNQRLFLGNLYIDNYGITFFPKAIPQLFLQREYDVIMYYNDNTFLALLLSSGLFLFSAILCFIFYQQLNGQYSLYYVFILSLTLISMIFESSGYNVFLFTSLFFRYFAINGKRS
ncbi:hypothetical protein BMT54_12085 [Pasteurellaceae bacterium 15-036681]|nr:hypothetical protein BMT54_12085 [Pasteurellaceae bacterium 15-036681]